MQGPVSYRVITTDGVQALIVHASSGSTDIVTLDAVARLFGLLVRDDTRAGGVVVVSGNDRVILTAGQSTVSSGGRLVSLSGPVTRAGTTWLVPVDFLRALNRGIEVRRGSRVVVVAPATAPRVTARVERTSSGGRLVVTLDPGVATRVTREGPRVTIRAQATALDLEPLAGAPGDLVAGLRTDGPSLVVDLGSAVTNIRTEDTRDPTRVVIELVGTPAPVFDRPPGIQTVVIDPGHGGDEPGARSADGLLEKHLTLAVAQRVKALLEARLGLRVVLTRDEDTSVPSDRRAALANNNKADLFISLHANGSPSAALRGAQALGLDVSDYAGLDAGVRRQDAPALALPIAGGGTRVIDAVPWALAQLPMAAASSAFATTVVRRLSEAGVVMQTRAVDVAPLRVLVGAAMPAILIELGVLTNPEDARALTDPAHIERLADAIAIAVADVRLGAGGQ
ncbi:MAG: hypothetical protein FJW21_04830 [Acidimicrobiia bacterium]|nr:hypothetical protein [Acidimicrobiia bacterium]